jgi:3-hydroxyacyl-CoA dehydrogenase
VELNVLQEYFLTIAMAKCLLLDMKLLTADFYKRNIIVVNKDRQIAEAKKHALLMAETGYTQPIHRTDVKVLGKQALGMFLVGTDQMEAGHLRT